MRIRVEGYNPTWKDNDSKHSDHDQYYIFDSLRYGPIHEDDDINRDELIKEFLQMYPDFDENDCRIIRVGEEKNIHSI